MAYENKSKDDYNQYNFQGKLIVNLADTLFELEEKISKAYQDRPGHFLAALSGLRLFTDKIIGMDLKYSKKAMKVIHLYLKLGERYYNDNRLLEGSEYLSKAYQKICNIIKYNDMMFPRNRRVTSFTQWAEQQLS
ncbi:MAG: hypothetical protein ACOC5T_04850 [Elusimicrobiota bacterium]